MKLATDFRDIDIDSLDIMVAKAINRGIPWFLLKEPDRSLLRLVERLAEIKPYDNLEQFNIILEGAPLVSEFLFETDYTKLLKKIDKTTLRERWLGNYRPLMGIVCNESIMNQHKIEVIDKLIQYGEDINAINEKGETALFMAVKRNNRPMIEMLLKKGANPNLVDELGVSPMMVATYNNHLYNMAILYHYKASLGDQCGVFNLTVYDIAEMNKCFETIALLKDLENISEYL